jgi:lysophospholipid acyltransferase (LPLAT)-like uncharacterized protein
VGAITVHNIPLIYRPFHNIFSFALAILLITNYKIRRASCTIHYINKEVLEQVPNYILCLWHENLNLFFITHPRFEGNHIAMTYPLWYMKPVHIFKKWIGFKELAYGASGIDGQSALSQVLHRLREGWSTFIAPDGPKGPAKMIKKGVLEMSLHSSTPIIPIRFDVCKERRDNNWDHKRIPHLFSNINVTYGSPIYVTADNYEESKIMIAQCMGSISI